jgi:hypothetical protein
MFVRSDPVVPEYAWLLHSPLKLFVTSAWAREDDPYSDPKDFLSHHTIIRSLIWGQAEEYDTNTNRNIGYTSTSLQDAILILQNAEIHRAFPFKKSSESQKSFEKFSEKMKEIKKFTIEELKGRIDIKDWYNRYIDSDSKIFRQKIVDCLRHLSDENIKNMKKLVTSFDPSSGSFTRSIYNKAS